MTLDKIAEHAVSVVCALQKETTPYADLDKQAKESTAMRVRKYLTTIPREPSGSRPEDAVFDAVCEQLGGYL